jgi:hypothetical protein
MSEDKNLLDPEKKVYNRDEKYDCNQICGCFWGIIGIILLFLCIIGLVIFVIVTIICGLGHEDIHCPWNSDVNLALFFILIIVLCCIMGFVSLCTRGCASR